MQTKCNLTKKSTYFKKSNTIHKFHHRKRIKLDSMSICFNATHVYFKGEWHEIIGIKI